MSDSIWVEVETNNYSRFLLKCQSLNINIYKVIEKDNLLIKILYKDFNKLNKIWFIKCHIVSYEGKRKIRNILLLNRVFIIGLVYGIVMCYVASNIIVNVKVIHSDKEIRELVTSLLYEKGIKKNSFRKSYGELEQIKKDILLNNKDKLEWLEIERSGVKYIVRVEERIITEQNSENTPSNIVAKKDAIIKDIDAIKGEVVKNINDYVKKGDTIITGEIKLYEELKNNVSAKGNVYGEVWYQASIEYPMNYYEEKTTGKNKKILSITLLNKKLELFSFHKFETKKIKEQIIYQNKLIPFTIAKEYQEETIIIDEQLNEEEAFNKAIQKVEEKINSNLKGKEKILNIKCLKKEIKDSTIILDLFISVLEDITEVKNIEIGDINVGDNT